MAAASFVTLVLLGLLGEFRKVLRQGCREILVGHLHSSAEKPDYLYRTECQKLLEWDMFPYDHMQFIRPVLQLWSAADRAFILEIFFKKSEPVAAAVRLFCCQLGINWHDVFPSFKTAMCYSPPRSIAELKQNTWDEMETVPL